MKPKDIDYFLHQLNTAFCILNWRMNLFYTDATETNKECLETELEYLKNMMNSFMTYKKLPTSCSTNEYESLNIQTFLETVLAKFSISSFEKNISCEISSDISAINIKTHSFFLEELSRVLIENAFKYTPPEGQIFIRMFLDGDKNLILSFENTGIGISEADKEDIWKPFFSKNNSSGLGLSIAMQLATALGFTLSCESDEKTYTKFLIYIPKKSIQ